MHGQGFMQSRIGEVIGTVFGVVIDEDLAALVAPIIL